MKSLIETPSTGHPLILILIYLRVSKIFSDSLRDKFYKLHVLSLAAVAFLLPLKIHYCNIAIVVSLSFWVFAFSKKDNLHQSRNTYLAFWLFISLYIIQIVGLIYTDNLGYGFFMLETKLALLLFPIMILLGNLSEKDIRIIMNGFISGVIIACLICHAVAIVEIFTNDLPLTDLIFSDRFHNLGFTRPLKIHPAYLSLCISILFFYILEKENREQHKWLWMLVLVYFVLCLFVLMSRAAIFGFMAALLAYVLISFFYLQRKFLKGFSILAVFSVITVASVFYIPNFKFRMVETMKNFEERLHYDDGQSTTLHLQQWFCAWDVVSGWNLIWGLGTGDEIDSLMKCYQENRYTYLVETKLDAHNEYMSSFVRHGVFGVLLFLASLIYSMVLAIKGKHVLYLLFTIMISIHAISVSILYGQASLIIYALFNCLFAKQILTHQRVKSGKLSSAI